MSLIDGWKYSHKQGLVATLDRGNIAVQIVTPLGNEPGGDADWLNVNFNGRLVQVSFEDDKPGQLSISLGDENASYVELMPGAWGGPQSKPELDVLLAAITDLYGDRLDDEEAA